MSGKKPENKREVARSRGGVAPSANYPSGLSKWKKAFLAALTPAAIIAGAANAITGTEVIYSPQQSPKAIIGLVIDPFLSSGGEHSFSEEWRNFMGTHGVSPGAAEQMALLVVDLANRYAGNKVLGPGFKNRLVQDVLDGSFGITPDKAAAMLVGHPDSASPFLVPVINAIYRGSYRFSSTYSEEWGNFIGSNRRNLGTALGMALSVVDLAHRYAGGVFFARVSPEFKYSLADTILTGSFGITPVQAADLLTNRRDSPLLAPVITEIRPDINPAHVKTPHVKTPHGLGRRPDSAAADNLFSRLFYHQPAEEWKNFIGADNANRDVAEQISLSLVDLAYQDFSKYYGSSSNVYEKYLDENSEVFSQEFKDRLANKVLIGSYDITPEQAVRLLDESRSPDMLDRLLAPIAYDITSKIDPSMRSLRSYRALGTMAADLWTRQSAPDSSAQSHSNSPAMWWSEGEWQPIPPEMLNAETSTAVLAINATKYPALAALIRYANDVDSYLRSLGIQSSIPEQEHSSNAVAEDEERDESGRVMVCLAEKIALGASLPVLAGSGVIAVIGAPTVVLSAAGLAVALGSLGGAVAALKFLKECYKRNGKITDADKLARALEQLQELQKEVAKLHTRLEPT